MRGQQRGGKKEYGPYYQWTRKMGGKTVTVNLTADQARVYEHAIREDRKLRRILERMRMISLHILAATTVGVMRRKRTVTRKPKMIENPLS